LIKLPTAAFVFVLPGIGTVAALLLALQGRVTGIHIALFTIGFVLTGFGITIGYHRLLTHRSFDTSPFIKGLLLVLGSMAAEGRAVDWVANHVRHHAYSEREGDPHSPTEGLLHSHWGWLFGFTAIDVQRYAAPILRDRVATWVSDTFVLWVIVGYAVPFLVAGWEGLIWGGFFRQFAVQNVTFAVNSVCHRWGGRPFKTEDLSRNNWIVGILGLGEGWHNNHHAFPTSAFHGLRWWEVDISGQVIRWLAACRLVWNVRRPALEQVQHTLFQPAAIGSYARATG
jgi:stearoyl-CoA desaturase (delta-9 desaturase)